MPPKMLITFVGSFLVFMFTIVPMIRAGMASKRSKAVPPNKLSLVALLQSPNFLSAKSVTGALKLIDPSVNVELRSVSQHVYEFECHGRRFTIGEAGLPYVSRPEKYAKTYESEELATAWSNHLANLTISCWSEVAPTDLPAVRDFMARLCGNLWSPQTLAVLWLDAEQVTVANRELGARLSRGLSELPNAHRMSMPLI
ncbi:MAG: hypothetical protein JNM85_09890 [Chthonomonas sp.]|nr:hypothetical protein [Chthonomonas sp.]